MSEQDKSLDLLGLKPLAAAAGHLAKASTDGVGAFLSRICLPAAEEFGLLLRDQVAQMRADNTRRILEKSENMYEKAFGDRKAIIPPRLLSAILNEGSWEDDEEVQSMWAGLLASSCSSDGKDQENLIFIRLLSNMTSSQAALLSHLCSNCKVHTGKSGLIHAQQIFMTRDELLANFGFGDLYKLDVAIDHMREIGVLSQDSGLNQSDENAAVQPSDMSLHFYARCRGFTGDVADFYKLRRDD